ncbi:MAG TPA: cytochrome c [Pseudomonadota bacterium]|nr:cytochrome c [Rhodanobacteraceae bacterium]MBP9156032.1 cytochrome c [Xanthomonadales bacterium]HQW80735.1 cytochrome c [Pseudomonadota bacterium]
MRKTLSFLVALSLVGATAAAQAPAPKPEQVIGYRQSLFKTVAWNFVPMGAMVKGSKPWDGVEFKRRSIAVAFAAVQLEEAFTAGSDKGAVTDALPEIWQQPQDFTTKLKAFQRTSNALRLAAAGGDQDRIKAAFGEVRQACSNCHDKFRAE